MLHLESPAGNITLNYDAALKLELELNLSSRNREWMILGDSLYAFHAKGNDDTLQISKDQFFWILERL